MNRIAVHSSAAKSIGYDPHTRTLEIERHNGKVYTYPEVTSESHQALISAKSIGSHLATHFKPSKAEA